MKRKAFTIVEFLLVIAIIAILAAFVLPVISSRKRTAQATEKTSNPGYDVQLLFMIDGMKVYRFYDRGRYIYVVDGRASKTVWNDTQQIGKTVADVPFEVPTIK